IKGPTAAAYLHRLTTAIQICRDILNLPDPRPDAHLTHDMNGLDSDEDDDPFNETDEDQFDEDEEDAMDDDDTANSGHDHR
ncbi:hypothetical protein, partial [Nocardiopsis coralliicola]